MNGTCMKTGLVAVLVMALLMSPVCAQAGNLGYDPLYPALPQKDATPDYLLTGDVGVTTDASEKMATLQFDTLLATPGATVYYGLYVPEQEIRVPQYRRSTTEDMAGEDTSHSIEIGLSKFETARYDICNFVDEGGVICYRIELYNPDAASSVFYDGRFRVDGDYNLVPCIIEGPFVDLVTTDSAVISWKTDVSTTADVEINSGSYTDGASGTSHEVAITGLSAGMEYEYDVLVDGVNDIKTYRFTTEPASPKFEFAVMSDSRAGVGGGERSFAGVNYHKLSRFTIDAYQNGADFVVFSGDLVNGYTTSMDDYRMQLEAWKDATEQVGCYIPIYEVMGNHESLLDVYDDGGYSRYGIQFDKQDDGVNKSAEAIFAEEFVNPAGGSPDPENTTAPSYAENVYYFDYGNTRVIAFNTNYWWCSHPEDFGGNLEGYVMDNQLAWIESVLSDAEGDSTIEHIFMFAHEPAFPNGGHLHDAQWYNGGESSGNEDYYGNPLDRTHVIERRDALWEAISQNGKVVAVFFGDEHNYNRMEIDDGTPVYLNGLTNPNFTNPVWQIITGGAGAPFYAQQDTPWSGDVEHFYPSKHYCLISVDGGKVSLKAISDSEEVVDECVLRDGAPAGDGGATELSAEVIPAISITVETSALDFGTIGAGLNSATSQIRIVNSGTRDVSVTAEIGADENDFYAAALRLNGAGVDGFSEAIPSDVTDFEYGEDVSASLVSPEWAGGEYAGTVLFVAEGI